jgi:hypothetical protein
MVGVDDLDWVEVKGGSVWLGSDDGRLQLSPVKDVPRHEVRIDYDFQVTRRAYTSEELSEFVDPTSDDAETTNLRPPSEAEWELAYSGNLLEGVAGEWEELADRRPRMGYWEQRCDGHPRDTAFHAKLKLARLWLDDGVESTFTSSLNSKSESRRIRLIRAPKPPENPSRLPAEDKRPVLIREALVALFVGIIPSFAWAYNFGSADYISNGWFNLVFGGLFIGVFSGFVWRPRLPSYRVGTNCGKVKRVK